VKLAAVRRATIETPKAIEREGQRPTPQEQRTLARYVG
jgi:hypothetical protein